MRGLRALVTGGGGAGTGTAPKRSVDVNETVDYRAAI